MAELPAKQYQTARVNTDAGDLATQEKKEAEILASALLEIRRKSGYGRVEIDIYKGRFKEVRVTYGLRGFETGDIIKTA